MTIWFSADSHLGHENIIKYANRPFKSVGEMDRVLIDRWNEVVATSDTVYHLGDFTLSEAFVARGYFLNLNGLIFVLANRWHHDRRWLRQAGAESFLSKDAYWVKTLSPLYVLDFHPPIVLCHYPLAIWDRKHYGAWHLHGHSHGRYQGDGFCMDVGVDANDFYPVSLEQVEEVMRAKGWHEERREYE